MAPILPHLDRILDLARWAPSGDNTQPWRFKILGDEHIRVQGSYTQGDKGRVVYDLDGHSTQLAVGALLETIVIAASTEGRTATILRRPDALETHLLFDVDIHFEPASIAPDPLVPYIEDRVVQRRSMSTSPLSAEQRQALADSLPAGYTIAWHEGLAQRWKIAKLLFDSAKIRLTIREAYEVHKDVIEWGAKYSIDRIPGKAVGVDPVTEFFMRWVMHSWERVEFFNTYLLGDFPPRLQLDLIPGLRCGAQFALLAPTPPASLDDYLAAGRAMQRFWLTASRLGWFIQPEMTPLIFARYHRAERRFTDPHRQAKQTALAALARAGAINQRLEKIFGAESLSRIVFMARIGFGPKPVARSERKPLEALYLG